MFFESQLARAAKLLMPEKIEMRRSGVKGNFYALFKILAKVDQINSVYQKMFLNIINMKTL